MDFIKTGTIRTKYLADGCEFKKYNDLAYTLKSTTNPKYNKFVGQTLTESKWDLIQECDYTEGPEYNKAYNALLDMVSNALLLLNSDNHDILLKKNEKILLTAPNISFSEPRAVRVTKSSYSGASYKVGKRTSVRGGSGKSVSQSTDVMTHIDTGVVTITNKRFIFSGSKRNVNVNLTQITSIDTYSNGIKLQRSNKQKVEQFIGFENVSFNFPWNDKKYYVTVNGNLIKAIILGGLNSGQTKKVTSKTTKKLNSKSKTQSKNKENESESNDDLLFKYAELYEKGLLTQEEFNQKKQHLLHKEKKFELDGIYCDNCGVMNDKDANFCVNCGSKLELK